MDLAKEIPTQKRIPESICACSWCLSAVSGLGIRSIEHICTSNSQSAHADHWVSG